MIRHNGVRDDYAEEMNTNEQNNINCDQNMQDGRMKDCGDDCEQPNNMSRHNVV